MAESENTAVVRARVNPQVKEQAEKRLEDLGITVSELIRMVLCNVAAGREINLIIPGLTKEDTGKK